MEKYQLADSSTVHGSDATKVNDHIRRVSHEVGHEARERVGLIAIDDSPLAMHNQDIAAISCFQTELQIRFLPQSPGRRTLQRQPRFTRCIHRLHPTCIDACGWVSAPKKESKF